MAVIFRSKLIEGKSGYFADSIGIGIKNPSGALHIASGDLIHKSGTSYFDNRPFVSGIPIMLSGEAQQVDLSNYVQFENLNEVSGVLNSGISASLQNVNSELNQASGVLQGQINNLNISANGASILSDYQGGISYIGRALVGSLESDPVWNIKKIHLTNSGTVSGNVLKSSNSIWTNRYNLNYA